MELDQSNKKIIVPVINTVTFDNFIGYDHVAEEGIHSN